MTPTPETMAEEYAAVKYEKFFGKHISAAWQEQRDAYLAGYAAALEIRSDSNQSSNQQDEKSAAWVEELQRLCKDKDARIVELHQQNHRQTQFYFETKAELDAANAKIEALELQTENLSAIVRRMARYATTREPKTACEKISELSSKCQHLLCETSPLKTEAHLTRQTTTQHNKKKENE